MLLETNAYVGRTDTPPYQLLVLGCYTAGTLIISLGGCRHVYYILADQGFNGLVDVTRLWTILQPLGVMAVAVGITSVAILILRIMGRSIWRRRFLYFSIVSTLVISITASVLLFAACKPVKGLWDPLVQASCWSPNINNDITIFTSCTALLYLDLWESSVADD